MSKNIEQIEDINEKEDKKGMSFTDIHDKLVGVAFGNIGGKLRLISKVMLCIFAVLTFVGFVLTVLLTSSLGFFGVIVALILLAGFFFAGYALSAFLYGYSEVVENSSIVNRITFTAATSEKSSDNKEEVITETEEEFPEF